MKKFDTLCQGLYNICDSLSLVVSYYVLGCWCSGVFQPCNELLSSLSLGSTRLSPLLINNLVNDQTGLALLYP